MADVWREFRACPSTFLASHRTNVDNITHELLEILISDEKSDGLKLSVLEILQECCSFLFENLSRLEFALGSLKTTFENVRHIADHMVSSQILVTMTVILIGSNYIESLQQFLVEFVNLLLDIVFKIKAESNRLLRAIACECLKELEMTLPGVLCDVVGSIYGLTVSENSFTHQHYMSLFATVLTHSVQKLALVFNDESSTLAEDNRSLEDLLFFTGNITFEPPQKYLKTAQLITTMDTGEVFIPPERDQSMLKKAVTHLVDHVYLFTNNYKVHVILQLIKIIKHSSLAPVMLKSLLLRYMSSSNMQLFHSVLLLKSALDQLAVCVLLSVQEEVLSRQEILKPLNFGSDICDEKDEQLLNKRLLITAVHPCLGNDWSSIAMQWFIQYQNSSYNNNTRRLSDQSIEETSNTVFSYYPLQLHIFDSPVMCWYKLQALLDIQDSKCHSHLSGYIGALQKPVLYGIVGPSSQLFYRIIVMSANYEELRDEIERAVVDVLIAHPKLTEHSVDMLEAIEQITNDRSMTRTVVSQMCQWLQSLDITTLSLQLQQHLLLLETAAKGSLIKEHIPLSILERIVNNSDVCNEGLWNHGNALLRVCYTLMQSKPDASISKSLVNLLIEIAKNYNEIDIRDRAMFYSQILLCVSSEKLQLLLTDSTGQNSDLSQVVVSRISDNVYPLPSPVRTIQTPAIVLNRGQLNPESIGVNIFTAFNRQDKVVPAYRDWIKTHDNIGLDIPCIVTMSNETPDWMTDTIYAVVLQFNTIGDCRNPDDIQITSLVKNGQAVTRTLSIFPTKPHPLLFTVSSTFALDDNCTCNSIVQSMEVKFQDFFHVMPINTDQCPLEELFTELWEEIYSSQYTCDQPDSQGALSVCCVSIQKQVILEKISNMLMKFCVDYDEQSDFYKIIIFLPPCYHLLLKVLVQETSTVFEIATDLWTLLPYINKWINNL